MSNTYNTKLQATVSILALTGAILHMTFPKFIPDAISAGLILLAVIPWLSPYIKSVDVPGIGKLELQVQEVKEKQIVLQEEIEVLRFLVSGFVTQWELVHLQKLASEAPFDYRRGSGKDDRFTAEIIRLWDFGLISKNIDSTLWEIPFTGDLKDYVKLTERGKTYLALLAQMSTQKSSLAESK